LDLTQLAASLSEIEKKTLKALDSSKAKSPEEISKLSGLPIDSVRRALQWLKEKELIELRENQEACIKLEPAGKSSLRKGLPEKMFVQALKELGGKATLDAVKKKSMLNTPELHASMGLAKKNAWISILGGEKGVELELTGLEKDLLEGNYALEKALEAAETGQEIGKNERSELLRRGLAEESLKVNRKALLNQNGGRALQNLGKAKQRAYNVQGAVPKIFIGKKQPYIQFLEQIRAKLVAFGFKEMASPLITQEFYNFDVLFQPQNHPARSWTDTYQLKQPKTGKLPGKETVSRVKAAHESGWKTGSRGWGYNWSKEIASRVMPTAHGTAHSARQVVAGVEVPGKYFTIARCYRPDVVDATHLIEFNQMEGFIVDESFTFKHLLGMLKQFAVEIAGAEEVKFFPDYYPFTEPSVQLSAKHPELGWVEFGGAGIFRPEMMLPLDIKEPTLAWGIGIDRLAMFKLGIKDIRYLFAQNLDWLRNSKAVVVE